jgi:mitochondrial cardiolipin hydrolase
MGCLLSTFFADDDHTAALQSRIRQLEQQLAAAGGGGGNGAGGNGAGAVVLPSGGGGKAGPTEVLWFPDPGMPCRFGASCRRKNCDYAHGATSLTRLIATLASARRSISVAVFSLTCDEIAQALLDAHRRGVRVRLITDDEQIASTGSDAASLRAAGIPVRHDGSRARLMHNKFAVIDGCTILTGSFNWTRSAVLFNDENVLVLRDLAVARAYERQFEAMWRRYEASARQPLPMQAPGGEGGRGGGQDGSRRPGGGR